MARLGCCKRSLMIASAACGEIDLDSLCLDDSGAPALQNLAPASDSALECFGRGKNLLWATGAR
jgi:hypothetical protein